MLDLLLERYNTIRRGTIADRHVRAEHVRSTQAQFVTASVADFVAIDKYAASQSLIGHEVKVSRSDWLSELRDPSKADRIKQFCHHWYLVVPDSSIVKTGELPEGWGLMTQSVSGLRVKVRAPLLNPVPLTLDFVAGLAAAVQRTAMREPLHRDAKITYVRDRNRCQSCGEASPCVFHQPRMAAA